eukprot:Platyproteum_vivax@DN2060_c0_g1_i1.p1
MDGFRTNVSDSLTFTRCDLTDDEGEYLVRELERSLGSIPVKKLQKLECEGNDLGPRTLAKLGEFLPKTKIHSVNLANNYLTEGGENIDGLVTFLHSLKKNATLRVLQIGNNAIDDNVLAALLELLSKNKTLVQVCIREPTRHLSSKLVTAINGLVDENLKAWTVERANEKQERSLMAQADFHMKHYNMELEATRLTVEAMEVRRLARFHKYIEQWKKETADRQEEHVANVAKAMQKFEDWKVDQKELKKAQRRKRKSSNAKSGSNSRSNRSSILTNKTQA